MAYIHPPIFYVELKTKGLIKIHYTLIPLQKKKNGLELNHFGSLLNIFLLLDQCAMLFKIMIIPFTLVIPIDEVNIFNKQLCIAG